MAKYYYDISDALLISDILYTNKEQITFTDQLNFKQTIIYSINHQTIKDTLNLNQNIKYTFNNKRLIVNDQLVFNQTLAPTHYYQFYDRLNFSQLINPPKIGLVTDNFVFYQHLFIKQSKFSINDNLIIEQYFNYSIIKPNLSMQSQIACDPIPSKTISLGGLVLRSPNLGNKDNYERTKINTKTRGGELLIGGPDFWPRSRIIELSFDTLKADEVNNLLSFLNDNLGKLIDFIDHENNHFSGIVITPSPEIKEQRDTDCSYSTSLSIQV